MRISDWSSDVCSSDLPTDLADNMRKASEPNVRALLMGFTMYSWSQRFGYSMDGVVGKTNQDVTRKLAQNNCLSLASSPRLGTMLGILSIRGALKKKDLGRIEPWATMLRAHRVDPPRVPGTLTIAKSIHDPLVNTM